MMNDYYEITIVVDTNDADYSTQISKISKKHLDLIKPLIEQIKNFKPYLVPVSWCTFGYVHNNNYSVGDCFREDLGEKSPRELYKATEEEFELFEEFLPWGEYGFHSIVSVEVAPFIKKEKLL